MYKAKAQTVPSVSNGFTKINPQKCQNCPLTVIQNVLLQFQCYDPQQLFWNHSYCLGHHQLHEVWCGGAQEGCAYFRIKIFTST